MSKMRGLSILSAFRRERNKDSISLIKRTCGALFPCGNGLSIFRLHLVTTFLVMFLLSPWASGATSSAASAIGGMANTDSVMTPGGDRVVITDPVIPLPDPTYTPEILPLKIGDITRTSIELVINTSKFGTFALYRQRGSGAFQKIRTIPADTNQVIQDDGLNPGTIYYYRLDRTVYGSVVERDIKGAKTKWRLSFQGPQITPDESSRVLNEFDWKETGPLFEGGYNVSALYYVAILIDDPQAESALRYMGSHVQTTPLFPQELNGWSESSTLVSENSQITGRWVYAVMPGSVFNAIRSNTLELLEQGRDDLEVKVDGSMKLTRSTGAARHYNTTSAIGSSTGTVMVNGDTVSRVSDIQHPIKGVDVPFKAVVFRNIPQPEAKAYSADPNILSYQYLGEQGFKFNAIRTCFYSEEVGDWVCMRQQAIVGWITSKLVVWAFDGFDVVVENVRSAIASIQKIVKGEVELELQFHLINTDPDFGTNTTMQSGWSGEELCLKNVKVHVYQGLAGFYKHTDDNGYVKLTVSKNVDTKIYVETENKKVKLIGFLRSPLVSAKSIGKLSSDHYEEVEIKNPYINTLASMTDTADYMRTVVDFEVPKITVLVGKWADLLAVDGNRAFAPCMGRMPNLSMGGAADALNVLGGLVPVVPEVAEFLYSVDIVLPTDDDQTRGVPTHEYGHAVMCAMLAKQDDKFQTAWTDVILSTLNQSAECEPCYIAEAFADFITSQVIGGTNYFGGIDAVVAGPMNYWNPSRDSLEQDFQGSTTDFELQIARVVSILHDAFDGWSWPEDPNDGSHWEWSSLDNHFNHVLGNRSDTGDETIALEGHELFEIFDYWNKRGSLITEDTFLGGLADLLYDRGYDESQVCGLFISHSPTGTPCPDYAANTGTNGAVSRYIPTPTIVTRDAAVITASPDRDLTTSALGFSQFNVMDKESKLQKK